MAPVSALMSVDLPAPFSPMSEWTSPANIRKSTSSSAVSLPKRTVAPCTSSQRPTGHRSFWLDMVALLAVDWLIWTTMTRCTTTNISSRAPIVIRVHDCSAPRNEIAVLIMP